MPPRPHLSIPTPGSRRVGVLWGIGSEAELREAGADPIVARPESLSDALGLA